MIDSQPNKGSIISMMNRKIEREKHGSIVNVDNTTSVDARESFFSLLNQIDTYGELRAGWILNRLGIE
jgi:hypothetical protein